MCRGSRTAKLRSRCPTAMACGGGPVPIQSRDLFEWSRQLASGVWSVECEPARAQRRPMRRDDSRRRRQPPAGRASALVR
eukprot:366191-Chlamydomonas_euryale.AAC.1